MAALHNRWNYCQSVMTPIIVAALGLTYQASRYTQMQTRLSKFDVHMRFHNEFMRDEHIQEVLDVIRSGDSEEVINEKLSQMSEYRGRHFLVSVARLARWYCSFETIPLRQGHVLEGTRWVVRLDHLGGR